MAQHHCENCSFRGLYDKKPQSLLGRLWRWHTNWCPGWRRYIRALPEKQRELLVKVYRLSPERFSQ